MSNDPTLTLEKIRDYAENLSAMAETERELQIANDIIYLIEDK